MLTKIQAGIERGGNMHSNPVHLTVISGTIMFEAEGSPPQNLGPGAGVNEVANVNHSVKCKEGADCLVIITGAKKFDSKPAK